MTNDDHVADDDTIVTKVSPFTVADTIGRLMSEIATRNMKVFAVIDHSGEAHGAGLDLRDTKVVIFGSPVAGTPVMAAAPLAALDLPLRVLIWADRDSTKISDSAPQALASRYQLTPDVAARLLGIDGVTDAVIDD